MIKVRRINNLKVNGINDVSIFQVAKSSLLGRIYFCFFRQIPFIRSFVIWLWIKILPIGFLIYSKFGVGFKVFSKFRSSPIKKLSEYSSNRQVILPSQLVPSQLPDVFPKNKNILLGLQSEYEFPEVYLASIENCTLIGASNFLIANDGIICHDLFQPRYDYTSEELHGRFCINYKIPCVTVFSGIKAENEIENGVVFTDAVSGNFAHFLTEVLPRVFVFSREYSNNNIPLIIDYGLHQNLMQALMIVVDENADLIELEMEERLAVKSLQVVSPCGYVPFDRRPCSKKLPGHNQGIFSSVALSSMRDYIKSKIPSLTEVSKPLKIFIRRNSGYRNVSNSKEIETMLLANGFVVVEPEKLNFIEQVEIFSNAEVVVGATGAAFANLIFCNSDTKIIILISDYKNMIYGYWQNMAASVGNKVTYVIGVCDVTFSNLHSDFIINQLDLLDAISD